MTFFQYFSEILVADWIDNQMKENNIAEITQDTILKAKYYSENQTLLMKQLVKKTAMYIKIQSG